MAACGALAGCSGSGSGPASGSRSASSAPFATSTAGSPSATPWTANVTWARDGLIQTGVPATPTTGPGHLQPGYALLAVAGSTVVTADYTPPAPHVPTPVTVQFRDAASGGTTAVVKLQAWAFGGMRADTVGGRPVVEVRYSPVFGQPGGSFDGSSWSNTVYDTAGQQLWTSEEQQSVGGYQLHLDPGTGAYNENGDYRVQDLSGKTVLTVPYHPYYDSAWPIGSPINSVQLIGGYAVVGHADQPAKMPTGPATAPSKTPYRFHLTFYDLGHAAKQVGDVAESYPVISAPTALAGCGGRFLLEWNTIGTRGTGTIWTSVLDLGSGKATAPVPVPAVLNHAAPVLAPTLTDETCSTALVSGTAGGKPLTFAVDLAKGTVVWRHDSADHDVSMRSGVIYALRGQTSAGGSPAARPAQLVAVSAADGSTRTDVPPALPLAFTGDGSAVFAKTSDPGTCNPPPAASAPNTSGAGQAGTPASPPADCAVTVWVGRS